MNLRRFAPLLLLGLVLLASGCVSVQTTSPGMAGGARRPFFVDGDAERIVVISAVERELELLLQEADIEQSVTIAQREYYIGWLRGHPVVLFLSGVSLVNATMATQAAIDYFPVSAIVFSGIAGGVNPNLAVGDVVVPSRWGQFQEMVFAKETPDGWDTSGRAGEFDNYGMMFPRGQLVPPERSMVRAGGRKFWFPADERMLAVAQRVAGGVSLARCAPSGECLGHMPGVTVGGNGLSGSVFVNNAEFREYLWRTFQGEAVDMETAAVAQTAWVNRIPFVAFRSLSDLAGGGSGANEIDVFGDIAADNSAAVVLAFLDRWR